MCWALNLPIAYMLNKFKKIALIPSAFEQPIPYGIHVIISVTQIALYVMFVSQVLYKAMFLFSPA
jgi:hypothetical protein